MYIDLYIFLYIYIYIYVERKGATFGARGRAHGDDDARQRGEGGYEPRKIRLRPRRQALPVRIVVRFLRIMAPETSESDGLFKGIWE